MADTLPTVDDLFHTAGGSEPLPTVDDLYNKANQTAKPISGTIADDIFNTGSYGRIAKAFGQAYSQNYGVTGINPELETTLRSAGLFNDYKDGQTRLAKSVNEAWMRPAIAAGTTVMATLAGLGAAAQEVGGELKQTATATQNIPVVGQALSTVIGGTGEIIGAAPEGFLPELHIPELHAARADRVLGEGESGYFDTKLPTPVQLADRNESIRQLQPPTAVPPISNIHTVARQIAPEVFTEYDALAASRDNFRQQIDSLYEQQPLNPRVAQLQDNIVSILSKVNGDEDRLTKSAAERLEKSRTALDGTPMKTDSPEMTDLRQKLLEADYRMRDLAPDVATAYRLASEGSTEPVQTVSETGLTTTAQEENASPGASQRLEMDNSIADKVSKQLTDLGRPEDEAKAQAALVQAYYETRASRFKGQLGTAEELYNREGPKIIKGQNGPSVPGKTLNQYGGIRSEKADKIKFNIAVQMEHQGIAPKKIKLATGWFRSSLDHKWRHEFSDQGADLMPTFGQLPESKAMDIDKAEARLEDVLHHPTLFEHYPDAKNIRVTKQSALWDMWKSMQGWFHDEKNLLNITPHNTEPLSTMLHEIQHWIQKKEGFARGGNTETVIDKLSSERLETLFKETLDKVNAKIQVIPEVLKKLQDFQANFDSVAAHKVWLEARSAFDAYFAKDVQALDWNDPHRQFLREMYRTTENAVQTLEIRILQDYFGKSKWSELTDQEYDPYYAMKSTWAKEKPDPLDKSIEDIKKKFVDLQSTAAKLQAGDKKVLQKNIEQDKAFKLYRDISGEIEARDVQARQQLTDKERSEIEPYSSQEYNPEEVTVVYDQLKRGSISITPGDAKNIIYLFGTSDASTFMHETAHDWLERLMQDAQHEQAPSDIILDKSIVDNWLKKDPNKPLTRAMHEKWARGFERYLMEGRAPIKELAAVFAKFKQWLTKIYRIVSNLRAPISDDIRDVFARLISDNPDYRGVTIAPEEAGETESTIKAEQGSDIEDLATPATVSVKDTLPKTPEDTPHTSQDGMSYNQTDYIAKDGKINFDNITSDETMQNFLRAYAEQNNNFVRSRGLGLTKSEIISSAEMFGTSARNMARNLEKLKKLTVDSPVPLAVRVKALEEYLRQNTQRLMDAAQENNPYALADATLKQLDAMRTFAGVKTSWAQVGHALQKASLEAKQGELINELLQSSVGRNLDQLKTDMARIRELDTPAKISAYIKAMTKSSLGEMLLEGFKNYLISGPLTHMMYAEGNKLLALMRAGPETLASAAVGAVREKITGKTGTERVYAGEVTEGLYAMMYGQRDGIKAMWDSFKAGQTLPLPGEDIVSTPFTATKHIPGVFGSIIRAPGERMVAPIHSADRTIGYLTNRAQLIYRQARLEGLQPGTTEMSARMAELRQDTPSDLMKEAVRLATDQALMGKSGDFTKRIMTLTNWETKLPILGRTQPLGFISPFVHVSGNINRMGFLERTPLGLASGIIRDDMMGKNGTLAQDIAIGRMAVGTAVWGAVGGLVYEGLVNAAAPQDYKEAAITKMTDGLPHSVKVGNMSYAFDRLGVWGLQLSVGTDLWAAIGYGMTTGQWSEASTNFGHSLYEHVTQEGFLSGISDLMKAIEESDRYGESWKKNFLSTIAVPWSIGSTQIAQQIDPYSRQARNLTDAIVARIPFASETLNPKVDIFGQPVPNKEFWGVYAQQIHDDPVLRAIEQDGYFPSPVSKKIRGVELTPGQYYSFATKAGVLLRQQLEQVTIMQGFNDMSPQIRHKLIESAVMHSREIAASVVMAQYPDILKKAYANKAGLVEGFNK